MSARWMTVVVWALASAAAVGWVLRVFVQPAPVPAGALVADTTPVLQADLTRLLGADPPPATATAPEAAPPPSARFALLGVVAPRASAAQARSTRDGVALIAIDDRPPRAFRVGARIEGDTVLQAVSARGAELGPRGGPVQVALQLPPPPPAATGTLPAAAPAGASRTPQGAPAAQAQPGPAPRPSPVDDVSMPAEKGPQRKPGPPMM